MVWPVDGGWCWADLDVPDIGGGPYDRNEAIRIAESRGYEIETQETVAEALAVSARARQ